MSTPSDAAERRGAFWICYVITAIAALVSLAYAIGRIVAVGFDDVDTLYLAARCIAIVIAVLITPLFASNAALLVMAVVVTLTQGVDAIIGITQADAVVIIGGGLLCLATIISASVVARNDYARGGND
jgi:hypothetical protein